MSAKTATPPEIIAYLRNEVAECTTNHSRMKSIADQMRGILGLPQASADLPRFSAATPIKESDMHDIEVISHNVTKVNSMEVAARDESMHQQACLQNKDVRLSILQTRSYLLAQSASSANRGQAVIAGARQARPKEDIESRSPPLRQAPCSQFASSTRSGQAGTAQTCHASPHVADIADKNQATPQEDIELSPLQSRLVLPALVAKCQANPYEDSQPTSPPQRQALRYQSSSPLPSCRQADIADNSQASPQESIQPTSPPQRQALRYQSASPLPLCRQADIADNSQASPQESIQPTSPPQCQVLRYQTALAVRGGQAEIVKENPHHQVSKTPLIYEVPPGLNFDAIATTNIGQAKFAKKRLRIKSRQRPKAICSLAHLRAASLSRAGIFKESEHEPIMSCPPNRMAQKGSGYLRVGERMPPDQSSYRVSNLPPASNVIEMHFAGNMSNSTAQSSSPYAACEPLQYPVTSPRNSEAIRQKRASIRAASHRDPFKFSRTGSLVDMLWNRQLQPQHVRRKWLSRSEIFSSHQNFRHQFSNEILGV